MTDAGCGSGTRRLRRKIPLLFGEESLKTVCFDSFIIKQALKTDAERLFKSFLARNEQWQRALAYKIPNRVGKVDYGVCFNCLSGADSFDYLAGVEVSDFSGLPAELSRVSIPAEKYAVFPHRERVSKLSSTIDTILNKWLPQSGHEVAHAVADAPDFLERYGEDFDPQTGTGGIEIWIPIKC